MSKHRTRRTLWERLLSGLLCLTLVLGLLPAAGLFPAALAANWADPYAEKLIEWGVMTYNPSRNLNSTITRAEFVAMCNRAFGYKRLGGTPFTDVPKSAWYAQDIDIAYNAGYFTGTSATTAYPNGTLTREMAAVAVARNLMLQETVGESLGFTDSHTLSEWSRGLIGTAVAEGVITGLPDGSFHPTAAITWGEVAALLVRLIGTPVNKEGEHELGDIYGNVVISSSNVTLRNTTIAGNLYITGGVDLGNVLLENVKVLGRIVISGGGEANAAQSSVILRNVKADEMLVDSIINQFVTISAYGITDIPVTYVRTDTYLEDACEVGYGLHLIQLDGESGTKLQLAGDIKEVINKTPFSELQLVKGTAQKITVDEYAKGSQVLVSEGTLVYEMNLDVATLVTGKGDIRDLNISAAGCVVDILPENVYIRPGITATIDGQEMGSLEASELSSEPRLLAGYPAVTNIAPTQAEGLFAANKPGTIYWAISELTSGSVTVDELINNPVYGGNIYAKQAGEINASSKTEYGRQISSLAPDGSYYISAVLVDGRGMISPLKVAAFTTPDNTVPAFAKGYPFMSLTTCETAQVTAMPNKNCVLYYALLPAGASAPTANEFKSGSIGGNYGYGSVNVVKNVPVSITVNRSKLQEKTTYVLYLWLTDSNGAQSMANPVRLEFTTPDETPPITTLPMQTGFYADKADVTFSINEAPATFYWYIVAEGTTPFSPDELGDLTAKIKVANGSGALVSGKVDYKNANEEVKFTISKLAFKDTQTHSFIMYYVAKDAAGNYSELIGSIPIRTLDTDPPVVRQTFTNPSTDGRPKSDSNIQLVFSEQVKGRASENELTFMGYYELVKAAEDAGDTYALSAAKTNLANALSNSIELWYVPKSSTGQAPVKLDRTERDWGWVDWSEATLELKKDGSVVLTLASGTAVSLGSGMTYYFYFDEVYDNAYDPNLLQAADENGKIVDDGKDGDCELPRFTTVYAQVVLTENEDFASSVVTVDGRQVRLDMALNVIPQSTSNMSPTECWDLIMSGDTWVDFEVYRKVVNTGDGGADDEDWKLVGPSGDFTDYDPSSGDGVSWNTIRNDIQTKPETVRDGLKQNTTYIYGIHFIAIKGRSEPENDKENEPEYWGDVINMQFSVVAGGSSAIRELSRSIIGKGNYDKYVNVEQSVSEVGLVNNDPAQGSIISLRKTFTDQQAPSFMSNFPRFTNVSSGSFTMELRLDRPGKLYYVVIPVEENGANIGGTVPIDGDNDGSAYDVTGDFTTPAEREAAETERDGKIRGYYGSAPLQDSKKTYIPISGADRDKYADYIYYMKVNSDGTKTQDGGIYDDPKSQYITGAKSYYPNSSAKKPDGPVELGVAMETVDVTGLQPNKEYYVYFVLQGGGLPSKVVQIYRVTTTKVNVPVVTITGSTTTATIRSTEDCELSFALVDTNHLPDCVTKTIGGKTILELMRTRAGSDTGGKSNFDVLTDAAAGNQDVTNLKYDVADYIRGNVPGTQTSMVQWTLPDGNKYGNTTYYKDVPIKANEPITWDFSEWMTSEDSEYVVLVAARHFYGGTTGDDYGFAALVGLYTPDDEPPQFKPQGFDKPGYLICDVYPVGADGKEIDGWRQEKDLTKYSTWSGSVEVVFDKPIYYNYNYTRYTIKRSGADEDEKEVDIMDILGGTAVERADPHVSVTGKSTVGESVTLILTNIRPNETITFFKDGKLCNAANVAAKQILTLRFNPYMNASQTQVGGVAELMTPGFQVSWG